MNKTIYVFRRGKEKVATLPLIFNVPNEEFNIREAVKKASKDYCESSSMGQVALRNVGFAWDDFALFVPNEFCEKHGFSVSRPFQSEEPRTEAIPMPDLVIDGSESLL